jgi:RNA polymerase sigma-70 factor (ECF subfamily)
MERDLFWTYLEAEHPRAEAFCRKLAGNREEGDDVYQDAVLTALRNARALRDPDAFRPWLYRIMVNTYRNRVVGPWWRKRVALSPEMAETRIGADPESAYAAKRWLDRGLAALKPEDRALVVLFEIDGWTIAELAGMTERPEGTIKARLARARKKMRQAIERYLPAAGEEPKPKDTGAVYAISRSEPSRE